MNILTEDKVVSGIELFSAWVESQMAYKGQPGLSVGVVYDQALIWAQGFGYADVVKQIKTTPQTIYRIASITKLFTATAVLQLRDAGKLQLDDPVGKHLPWFTIQNNFEDVPIITIRHLLTHTAGLPREAKFPYWTDANFPALAQIQKTIRQQETTVPAATRWKYSNLAFSLAGAIVAEVSGQPYVDYVRDNVLRPLDMTSTFVETIDPDHERLAVGYGRRLPGSYGRDIMPFTDCQGITPAANIATSVEDLAKFAMLQFRAGDGKKPRPAGGDQILQGSTLREMQRIHWLNVGWQEGWGLGFSINRRGDKTYIGHGGALLGYRTLIQLLPSEKVGVIVLTNADDGNPLFYLEKAFEWIVAAVLEAVKREEVTVVADPAWQQYLGLYRNVWSDTQIMLHKQQLIAIDPSLPDPMPFLTRLIPISQHTFRMETKFGGSGPGELAIFHLDESGNVARLQTGENFRERIEKW